VNIGTEGSHDAVSSEHGLYKIPDIEPGFYSITFSKAGYFDTTLDTSVVIAKLDQIVDIDVVLEEIFGTITGTVIDTLHEPASGVEVIASGENGTYSVAVRSDGTFTLSEVHLGTYQVEIVGELYTDTVLRDSLDVENHEPITLDTMTIVKPVIDIDSLLTSGTISGMVKDSSGNAISGVSVTTDGEGFSSTTDTTGEYTIANVDTGNYEITFTHPYFLDTILSDITVEKSDDVTAVDMVMENDSLKDILSAGTISGTVIDSAGQPISGVAITTDDGDLAVPLIQPVNTPLPILNREAIKKLYVNCG